MRISDWSSDVCSSDLPITNSAAASPTKISGQLSDASDGPNRKPIRIVAPQTQLSTPCALDASLQYPATMIPTAMNRIAPSWISRNSSEERRVGKECVSSVRSRRVGDNSKTTNTQNNHVNKIIIPL